ncbi:MAG: hypothetical protein JWQ40_2202 [Segetibacter sp.]|nr:hypothetical protein [Segetibacter sp.]
MLLPKEQNEFKWLLRRLYYQALLINLHDYLFFAGIYTGLRTFLFGLH